MGRASRATHLGGEAASVAGRATRRPGRAGDEGRHTRPKWRRAAMGHCWRREAVACGGGGCAKRRTPMAQGLIYIACWPWAARGRTCPRFHAEQDWAYRSGGALLGRVKMVMEKRAGAPVVVEPRSDFGEGQRRRDQGRRVARKEKGGGDEDDVIWRRGPEEEAVDLHRASTCKMQSVVAYMYFVRICMYMQIIERYVMYEVQYAYTPSA